MGEPRGGAGEQRTLPMAPAVAAYKSTVNAEGRVDAPCAAAHANTASLMPWAPSFWVGGPTSTPAAEDPRPASLSLASLVGGVEALAHRKDSG